jgi:hypothetical protein
MSFLPSASEMIWPMNSFIFGIAVIDTPETFTSNDTRGIVANETSMTGWPRRG